MWGKSHGRRSPSKWPLRSVGVFGCGCGLTVRDRRYIAENGGTYRFGNATCKKKFIELQKQGLKSGYGGD